MDELCCDESSIGCQRAAMAGSEAVNRELAEDLADVFRALADPTRVRIISVLAAQELCVGDLAERLDMTISAISHQLRLLRRMRVVRVRRDGRHIYYALDDEHISTLYQCGLEHLGHRG